MVRGVGLDEACVHPPKYQANKLLLGVPPYCPIFQIYLGPLQSLLGRQSSPCHHTPVHVGMRGG